MSSVSSRGREHGSRFVVPYHARASGNVSTSSNMARVESITHQDLSKRARRRGPRHVHGDDGDGIRIARLFQRSRSEPGPPRRSVIQQPNTGPACYPHLRAISPSSPVVTERGGNVVSVDHPGQ